jgi:glycosyltransferase involved in cell wall biosynthesis
MVLRSTIDALDGRERGILFVGSQGQGILDEVGVPTRRYWYRRSRYRLVTLFTYFFSQVALYFKLMRSRDIPRDATIFVNTLLPFGAMLWGRRTGRRVVIHVHEVSITPGPLRRFLTSVAARSADLLLYVSNDHRARLPIVGPPSLILPNPVSPVLVSRAGEHIERQDRQFRVLMLASLRGYKGIKEFMALAGGLRKRADITFDLVLNAEAVDVAAFAKRHSEETNITIHPRTADPAFFYSRADLVLNLSRIDQWVETFGLTIVEGMSFGLPAIVPPVGGPPEIVTHGIDGYCIDSRDGAALRHAVVKLVDEPEAYNAMSRAARKRARDFTFDSYSAALHGALNSLVSRRVK